MATKYRVNRGCTYCGTCVHECPVRAVTMDRRLGAVIDAAICIGCGVCYENCASEAIEPYEAETAATAITNRGD